MPAFARAILIQESAEGGLSYKAKKRRIATTLLSCSEVILLLWQYQSFAQSLDFACSLYPNSAPIFSLKSGLPFQLTLQSLLLVLGCGQLALRNILFVSQLFQFFAHG